MALVIYHHIYWPFCFVFNIGLSLREESPKTPKKKQQQCNHQQKKLHLHEKQLGFLPEKTQKKKRTAEANSPLEIMATQDDVQPQMCTVVPRS